MNFGEAIQSPLRDNNWLIKTIIGGLLRLVPIISFFSYGFLLETLRRSIAGEEGVPDWDDWGRKFVQGLMTFFIVIVYGLIPLIMVLAGGVGAMGIAFHSRYQSLNPLGLVLGSGIGIAAFLVALVIGFILPMALAAYGATGKLGAAFALSSALGRIKTVFPEYLISYLLIIGLSILSGMITSIPLLGWLLSGPISFYIGLVAARLFGSLYARSNKYSFWE